MEISEKAEQLFYNNFDCYADLGKSGFVITEDIPAMTKERFVEVVKELLYEIDHLKFKEKYRNIYPVE